MPSPSPAPPLAVFITIVAGLLSAMSLSANPGEGESSVPQTATGTFEVRLAPLELHYDGGDKQGRMSIDKTFHGDLDATGQGEMLTAMTSVKGSAAYVAIEQISGSLNGRQGTFVLHHRGIMDRNGQSLDVSVVPDSGTGELEGISGEMKIRIEDGKHFYTLEYTLP